MGKTNKELAVDLTMAIINANPKMKYANGQAFEKIDYSLGMKEIDNILNHYYELISKLR